MGVSDALRFSFVFELAASLPRHPIERDGRGEHDEPERRAQNDDGRREHRAALEARFDPELVSAEELFRRALPTDDVAPFDVVP